MSRANQRRPCNSSTDEEVRPFPKGEGMHPLDDPDIYSHDYGGVARLGAGPCARITKGTLSSTHRVPLGPHSDEPVCTARLAHRITTQLPD